MTSSPDLTALLEDWSRGDRRALDRLLPLVYAELRRIPAQQLRRERGDHTVQPTADVHEAYLRLVDLKVSPSTAKREWRTVRAWLARELGLRERR